MTEATTYTAVDRYIDEKLAPHDDALGACVRASAEAGLRPIAVTPSQGKLLHLLALSVCATRILEIGTLGGYSAIWLARALPAGGRLVTLDVDPKAAEVARANVDRAGVGDRVEIRLGLAMGSLDALAREGAGPFDLVFIDANKDDSLPYFERALAMSRPGTLLVVDNVVRAGRILDAASTDPDIVGLRRLFDWLATEPRVDVTAFQTVGEKHHDGMIIARVR